MKTSAVAQLMMIAQHHGLDPSPVVLLAGLPADGPVSDLEFRRRAKDAGLNAKVVRLNWPKLSRLGQAYPALLLMNDDSARILAGYDRESDRAVVFEAEGFVRLSRPELKPVWNGKAVLFAKAGRSSDRPFGLSWFFDQAARMWPVFARVGVAAAVLHLIALAMPLFFQTVVDKVLPHESTSTLTVLAVAMAGLLVFDGVFKYLRGYLLAFAAARLDLRLGVQTFAHLVRLPLSFFDRSSAGVVTKHMGQTEQIREFLTSNLLGTVLDASVLVVFIPMLFMYSPKLAWVVLGVAAAIALFVALLLGPFSRRLNRLYEAEGEKQAYLVQAIVGARTAKSHGIEAEQQRAWEERSAKTAEAGFAVEKLSAFSQAGLRTLEKGLGLAVVVVGAHAVFDGTLSLGGLIAFQMIAANVTSPLVQVVEMAHKYQRVLLSVRMLGEVMNRRPEATGGEQAARPRFDGGVTFSGVTMAYDPGAEPAVRDVTLDIRPGEVIGVVGPSGAGKSTITRLLLGQYPPQKGTVRLGTAAGPMDLRQLDTTHLRRSVGVVLQENYMYAGTVRENIALARPTATAEEVVRAARLAGADEFIDRLPAGYDTVLEEGGSNLSGGQKQRLAIARALLKDPSVLILDEATSALDVESETVIQRNLEQIAAGRTMIIVAHRLSTLRNAHRIVVMNRGQVVQVGPHTELISSCPLYRDMWNQQLRNVHGHGS